MTDISHAVFQECLRLTEVIKQKCPLVASEIVALSDSLEYLKKLRDVRVVSATPRDFVECKTYPDAVRAYLEEIGEKEALAVDIFEGLVSAGYPRTRLPGARTKFNHGIVAQNSAGIETIKDGANNPDDWVVRIRPKR